MKKLLLFLMAFLLFTPPEAIAETRTETIFEFNTTIPEAKYSTLSNPGQNDWLVFSKPSSTAQKNIKTIKIPIQDYKDYVIIKFDDSQAGNPTINGNVWVNMIGLAVRKGTKFTVTTQNGSTISALKFTNHSWGTSSEINNLQSFYNFKSADAEENSDICSWNKYPSSLLHTISFNKPQATASFYVGYTEEEAASYEGTNTAIDKIEITTESKLPAPLLRDYYENKTITDEYEFDNSTTLRFTNGTIAYPEDTRIYYTLVPNGADVTEFPVGEEAETAGIKSVALFTNFLINQSGILYYWLYSKSENSSSLPTKATLIRNNRVQIFAFLDADQSKLNGSVKIFNDKYPDGTDYIQPKRDVTQPGSLDWYQNVKRILYLPSEPGITDAIILDVIEGNLNITNNYVVSSNAKFVIRSLSGAELKKETFDCSTSPLSTATIDYIYSDDEPYPTYGWQKISTKKKIYTGTTKPKHTFYMDGNASGFADLSVVWEPSTANKIAAAPSFSVAPGSTAVQQGGVFRIIDKLDLLINSTDGPVYSYIPTTDELKNLNTLTESLLPSATKVYDGNVLTITKDQFKGATSGKIILQSALYSNELSLGYAAQIYVDVFQPEHFTSLAEIIKPENTGKEMAVMADSPMTITGVYATRKDGGAQLSSYYAYVVDADGTAIKLVSTSPFPASYTAGAVIPAGGLVGEFRYSYGAPEIVVSNYTGFLKETTPGTAPEPAEVTTISTSNDDGAIPDFNRKVVLRHAKWLRNTKSSQVEDTEGNRYLIYSRLITPGVEAYEFTEDMFKSEAGTLWAIEGYVGQVEGATAIFPTAKVLPCPATPTLLAPNPISDDVNAISPEVNVKVNRTEGYTYHYKTAEDGELKVLPEVGLTLKAGDYTTTPCDLWVYASANGLYSWKPAHVTITWHPVANTYTSIADFKADYLKDELTLPGSLTEDKPEFGEDETVVYTQFSPEAGAVVVETTPEWLYIRDNFGDEFDYTSNNYLMIHNRKKWHNPQVGEGENARDLAPGDIITNFALIPAHTSRGNLVSESTGFARTVQFVKTIPGFEPAFKPINVGYVEPGNEGYYTNIKLGEAERMRLVQLKNVRIKKTPGANPEEDVYTLVIGSDDARPITLAFDIFTQSRNGFDAAYNDKNPKELYDIKGVLIRDNRIKDNETYALALISFDTQNGAVAAPEVFVQGTTDAEAKAAEVQEFEHGLVVEITPEENSFVYYSLNGKDPLNNTDAESRISYSDPIPVTLPEGQDRVVVKAFAYRPGYKPSATVTRTFVKTSRELSYLLNFINQGEQGRAYHFNGNVRIAAVAGNWMMVRGSVGHYLPIYNADGWNTTEYAAEKYLTDFLMTFDNSERNIRGMAKDFKPSTDKPADIKEIELTPDSVTFISEANARRYVKLHSALVHSGASAADASTTEWTVTGTAHESSAHRLAVEMLDFAADKLRDGGMYDIEGFVMLGKDGKAELWPLTATEIKQTERVEVKLNDVTLTPVSDASDASREYVAEFEKGALVTLFTSDTRESTKIYYSYDNEKWYTYGQPFLVLESANQIHTYAQAVGERASAHTHIKLTRKDVAAKVEFAVDNSIAGRATVTLSCATEGAKIYWWTSSNTKPAEYAKALVFNESEVIYAYAAADGKADSEVSHAFVKVAGSTGTPDIPADKISGKVVFSIDDTSDPKKVTVYLAPEEGLTGTIYYLINPTGQVTPDNGLVYTNPIEMKEGGRIVAILVENGKYAGEPTDIAVWLIPTDIDGIDSERREDEIRAEGGSIIAPEGSEVFDITGRRVNATGLRAGIYIVRTPGGKAVKVKVD